MSTNNAIFTMDDEETPSIERGVSDDEIIATYIKLDRRMKDAAADRQWYASALAQRAVDERNGQKTVHLENSSRAQTIKVEFRTEWAVQDEAEMDTVRELLGPERFAEIFKTQYVPKVKELKLFLNTGSTSERVKTAKAIIQEAVKEIEKPTPTVSVEKS